MIANFEKLPFNLPVHEIRCGYYTDVYFNRSKEVLLKEGHLVRALMQVFQKREAILCGMREVSALLRECTGFYRDQDQASELFTQYMNIRREFRLELSQTIREKLFHQQLEIEKQLDDLWEDKWDEMEVQALKDGERISPWETVLTIEGVLAYYIHLETIYLGYLTRGTRIATNVHQVVEAANGKPVLFFPARFDRIENQEADGYAARIGGAAGVSTDAQGFFIGQKGSGTIPHALIAAYKGNTVQAVNFFHETHPDVRLIALVDFQNNCVQTSLETAEALGEKLWGVRLDTSGTIVDFSLINEMGYFNPLGVNPVLVEKVRTALDNHGFSHVKIVVSGGFNPVKIHEFEKKEIPVDAYGVGSALMQGVYDFTADVVLVEGKPCAKVGRTYRPNHRLTRVT